MSKVTVIMPSLNVAKYIRSCMESVLSQTLKDIEILAIDAGSNDGTFEILQEYAALDRRIRVIHSDKKSYGYQLNMGISLAQGEYVGVVETDDKIIPDMFQMLYDKAVETGADYVKGCARSFMEITQEIVISNRIICVPMAEEMGKLLSPRQYPKLFVTDRFLWLGIYRRDFVKTIKLNETLGAAFQDIGFMFQVICNADRAVYLDRDVYFYRQDNVGASSHDKRGFRYLVEEYKYVKLFLQGKERDWYQVYYRKMLDQCMGRFRVMAASGSFWEEMVPDMENLKDNLKQAVEYGFLVPKMMDKNTEKRFGLFLRDIEDIYGYYLEELQTKKTLVRNLLEKVSDYQVVIFGCGAAGEFTYALLKRWNCGLPVAYCDNNIGFWNTRLQGLEVFSPEETVYRYPEAVYVVTGRKSAEVMRRQLREMGVEDDHICIFQEGIDMMLL